MLCNLSDTNHLTDDNFFINATKNLNCEVTNDIANLPLTFNSQSDLSSYAQFINKWGTHWIQQVIYGGQVYSQVSFKSSYYNTNEMIDAEIQAQIR